MHRPFFIATYRQIRSNNTHYARRQLVEITFHCTGASPAVSDSYTSCGVIPSGIDDIIITSGPSSPFACERIVVTSGGRYQFANVHISAKRTFWILTLHIILKCLVNCVTGDCHLSCRAVQQPVVYKSQFYSLGKMLPSSSLLDIPPRKENLLAE